MKDNSVPEHMQGQRSRLTVNANVSQQTIKRRMRAEAVQHPATLLPLAASVMAFIYLIVLSPVFRGGVVAMVLLVFSGAVAAAGFVWRYTFRYADEYTRLAREMQDQLDRDQEKEKREEMLELYEDLRSGFLSINSTKGLEACGQLADEYGQLAPALSRRSDSDPLSISHLPILAGETYRRGLELLSDALELMKAANIPERQRLQSEISELERDSEAFKGAQSHAERLRIKEDTLASHRQLLETLDKLQLHADQLLFQAGRCQAALHHTRIELTAVRTGSSHTRADSVIEALERTISRAKEVQEELR